MQLVQRHLREAVPALRAGNHAIAVTGPRQSGKTTFARQVFDDLPYVNFESFVERSSFAEDPVGFLARFPDGAILDEALQVPEVFSSLQVRIDADRRMGRWVLTGSHQTDLLKSTAQSLAGRVPLLELLPFSLAELDSSPAKPRSLAEAVLRGGYPPLYDPARQLDPVRWLEDYLATFVARDVRALLDVRNRTAYDRFLRLCAGRTGQLLNTAALARDAGIDNKTAGAWISVLEACYVVFLLRPHHRSFGKRLVKQPKLFFVDSGLACRLLHIADRNQLTLHPLWGPLVETWCVTEVLKSRRHRDKPAKLWFWRSNDGLEVDLLVDQGNRLVPIEIKSSATPKPDLVRVLRKLRALGERDAEVAVAPGLVIYGGEDERVVGEDRLVPWFAIDAAMRGVR